jgi:ABC-type methionine transport system ATPase subunit
MSRKQVMFTFPPELVKEPIIYNLGRQFNIVTSIRRAGVTQDRGWVVLELEGDEADTEAGLNWVKSKGVRIDPADGDVVEG